MAFTRTDATKSEGEKPEKRPESSGAESGKAAATGLKAWLPLIGAVVAMPVVAYGVTTFILIPKLQQGLGLAPQTPAPASQPADPHSRASAGSEAAPAARIQVPLTKLIVNVKNTQASRYLMVSLVMVSAEPDFQALIKEFEPHLKDTAGVILATKSIQDLETPGARNLIRSELITAFNRVLGGTKVQEIYFTDFAIQ